MSYFLKSYQLKNLEIFIYRKDGTFRNQEKDITLLESCDKIFKEILSVKNMSRKKIFEVINLRNNKINLQPLVIESLLRKKDLPALLFLGCNN
jgi:hypothetical protein